MLLKHFKLFQCLYCAVPDTLALTELEVAEEKVGKRIKQGVIYCGRCQRWFMVKDEICFLSQDHHREVAEELSFLKRWEEKLPTYVTQQARPHNLSSGS